VHAEHREIYDSAMVGNELRAALALEAHIRTTTELVARALHGNGHA
jgi:GntR family carbon starvation induced transcriptional regulator